MPPIQSAEHPLASQPIDAGRVVEMLMSKSFDAGRTPRSDAYMSGVRALLVQRLGLGAVTCPFSVGAAEFDAFFAGVDEGRATWAEYQLSNTRSA